MEPWFQLPVIIGSVVSLVILGLAVVVLWKIFTNQIDLTYLVAEADGKASLSRFQFLVFTFVVAGVFLLLSIESGAFVEIPEGVLILLGVSGGSYVLSKGITANAKQAEPGTPKGANEGPDLPPAPPPRVPRPRG